MFGNVVGLPRGWIDPIAFAVDDVNGRLSWFI
jgi:hypothetical protein